MKVELGDYLLWNDHPAKVVCETSSRVVTIELLHDHKCPHCNESLGREQINVVVSSPMFENGAKPMKTIIK